MEPSPRDRLGHLFEPLPLPRSRAILALVFGGLALLALGGVLAYASESPDLHGGGATRYWSAFFLYYGVALGGAAILGAFPRLVQPRVQLGWTIVTLALAAVALWLRHSARPVAADEWWLLGQQYLPGLLPLMAGWRWKDAARLHTQVDGLPVR